MVKKEEIRNFMLKKRLALKEEEIESFSRDISINSYSFIKENSFKKVAIYMSIKNEVRIEYLIDLNKDKEVNLYLPQTTSGHSSGVQRTESKHSRDQRSSRQRRLASICFNKFEDAGSLEMDKFGILSQKNGHLADINEIDVFFVPGLAFDIAGNRVGYGKGCYDRALSLSRGKALFVGVCYSFQVLKGDEIESRGSDIKMHYLFTEKGIAIANPAVKFS